MEHVLYCFNHHESAQAFYSDLFSHLFFYKTVCSAVIQCSNVYFSHRSESEELQRLEEEQEQLNSSLLALTTHFAQVQFRLKQIVSADNDDKEVCSR
jgi:hypothetical protein